MSPGADYAGAFAPGEILAGAVVLLLLWMTWVIALLEVRVTRLERERRER